MRKSVLLVTHEYLPYPGGIGRYCAAVAAAADAAGYAVDVIAPAYDRGDHIISTTINIDRFPGGVFRLSRLRSFRK